MAKESRKERDEFVTLRTSFGYLQKSHEDVKDAVDQFEGKIDKKFADFLEGIRKVEEEKFGEIESKMSKLKLFILIGEYPRLAIVATIAIVTMLVKEGRDVVISLLF